jgi:hypothetical protein
MDEVGIDRTAATTCQDGCGSADHVILYTSGIPPFSVSMHVASPCRILYVGGLLSLIDCVAHSRCAQRKFLSFILYRTMRNDAKGLIEKK